MRFRYGPPLGTIPEQIYEPWRGYCAVSVDVKPDTLGERKLTAEIDGAGDAAHIGFPRVRACLAPAAGFLFAPECAADFRAGWSDVGIGDPAVGAFHGKELLHLANIG